MKKKQIKNITNEEKLEFYQKYTNTDFQEKLQHIEDKHAKIGLNSIKIFFVLGIFGMFISPWCVFLFLPGFIVPLSTLIISHNKIKKEVNKLCENITYEDFIKMIENGEFYKLGKDTNTCQTIKSSLNTVGKTQKIKHLEDNKNLNNQDDYTI